MNFGLCHTCGSDKNIVYCDGFCSRAYCEKCIDAALGGNLHDLFTKSDVELVCSQCEENKKLCWICKNPTNCRGIFDIYVCPLCMNKGSLSENCEVCGKPDKLVTCYYCLKSYHEECADVLRLDEYSHLTAGVCSNCRTIMNIVTLQDFKGVNAQKADLNPYEALLGEKGEFQALMQHLQPEIFKVPFNHEYQLKIALLCNKQANEEILDAVPEVLNTLPLKSYNLDVIEWILIAIEGCMIAARDNQIAYDVVRNNLLPYKKQYIGKVIKLLPQTIDNQFE